MCAQFREADGKKRANLTGSGALLIFWVPYFCGKPPGLIPYQSWFLDGRTPGLIQVFGGYNANRQATSDLHYYEAASDSWHQVSADAPPSPRQRHTAVWTEGLMHLGAACV